MAMPRPYSFTGQRYQRTTDSGGNINLVVSDRTVVKCRSSWAAKAVTPFKYRIKTWVYKGRVYERLAGWIYPKRKPKVSKMVWRDPKPYSCSKEEGDVNYFNGYIGRTLQNPSSGPAKLEIYGYLSAADQGVACPDLPSGFNSALEQRAVVKALLKLKDEKVNLAVAFAERTETAELLVGTLSGLAKAARSLSRGDLKGVAKGLGLTGSPKAPKGQTFHEKWLELQYGWRPLYQDVYGAVSALHAADQAEPKRYSATVKGNITDKFHKFGGGTYFNYGYRNYTEEEGLEGAFVRLDYNLRNPFLASLSQLGITNPALVVWERVPFSFVVDWFVPVGNYLSAFDATLGWDFRAGSLTRLFRRKWRAGIVTAETNNPDIRPLGAWGEVNVNQLKMQRTIYGSSPLPRIPSLKNPFPHGGMHIANAIALFASSLRH